MPSSALPALRFLEIAFPILQKEHLRYSKAELDKWLQSTVHAPLNLQTLTLRICLSDSIEMASESYSYFNSYLALTYYGGRVNQRRLNKMI